MTSVGPRRGEMGAHAALTGKAPLLVGGWGCRNQAEGPPLHVLVHPRFLPSLLLPQVSLQDLASRVVITGPSHPYSGVEFVTKEGNVH